MEELDLTSAPEEELLLQPGDDEGKIPPTYAPGNLPAGEPVEAVLRARPKFYGPLTGPFAVRVTSDILQVGEDWHGYIRQMPDGSVLPVHEKQFARLYEIVGVPPRPGDEDDSAVIAELTRERDDLEAQLQDVTMELETLQASLVPPENDDDDVLIQPDDDVEPTDESAHTEPADEDAPA